MTADEIRDVLISSITTDKLVADLAKVGYIGATASAELIVIFISQEPTMMPITTPSPSQEPTMMPVATSSPSIQPTALPKTISPVSYPAFTLVQCLQVRIGINTMQSNVFE